MSDVEKAISGEDGDKTRTKAKTNTSTATATGSTLNSQQQQQPNFSNKPALTANHSEHNHCDGNDTGSGILNHTTITTTTPAADTLASNCVSRLLKIVFSTPGLVVLVVAYSVMGALIFPLLEAPQDITKSAAIAKSREDCLRELWIITEKLNVLYERNWTMLVHEQLRRFEGSIVAATRTGGAGGTNGFEMSARSTTALGHFGGTLEPLEPGRWSFSEALLYSVTVITTIGHGSLTPKTAAGKIATILYALIGVPLMLMCLSSLGALLAEALQCTYARICCRLARHGVINSSGRGDGKRLRRCSHDDSLDGREKKHDNDGECHGQSHVIDCKSCKYDAVMGETNLNNGYEYGGSRATTIERGEDSCKLLHNSPAKVNHNAPCMQLQMASATATMATNAQYYQRMTAPHMHQHQQQQHQQHQQRPDVMLMTTSATAAHKLSLHQQQQQQQQQQCSRSNTPSPQQFQHPLQTFHIVSSASANSSPTHQTLRQYATLQPQHQHHPHHHHQQHFVAVPSSMVRFQAAPSSSTSSSSSAAPPQSNCINASGDAMPPNCYPPASSVAVAGAATIYFPIATAVPAAASSSSSATSPPPLTPATAAGSTTVAAASQLMCHQPLVKYHTIQLQHKKPSSYSSAGHVDVPVAGQQQHIALSMAGTMPLPPPPAYQTATVHGVRRAKFLTKPLPQEINTLLAENENVSCRHDLSQTSSQTPAPAIPTSATTAAMLSTGTTTTTSFINTLTPGGGGGVGRRGSVDTTSALGSNATVDIMEDEEENEQHRIGNCPHGTPSRVPLISGGNVHSTSSDYGANKEADKSSRGLINATAASFHRHTLHTFDRAGSRKSTTFVTRRGGCNNVPHGGGRSVSGCYGDTTETSDDDEYMQQQGSEQFVLDQIDADEEEEDDDDDANDYDDGPQVPISIVLLILVCYICLGTVIFAFWENWSLIDGAYFCFVTLATIGYGDFLPERTFQGPEVQLFACCAYLLLGLVLVAMSFSILETQLMWKCKRIAVRLKLAKD